MFLPIIINEIDCAGCTPKYFKNKEVESKVEIEHTPIQQKLQQKPKSKFRQLFCRHNYNQCSKCGKYKTTLGSFSRLK